MVLLIKLTLQLVYFTRFTFAYCLFCFFAVLCSNYSPFVAVVVVVYFTQLTLGTSHCRDLTKSLGKC